MKSLNTSYLPAVDHLRAFAAVLVILHHAIQHVGGRLATGKPGEIYDAPVRTPLDALVIEGHTGVALFMVLSGFIFTHIAYGHQVRYWPFLANRILRIYPLMLFLLLAAWLARPAAVGIGGLLGTIFIPFSLRHPVSLWFIPDVHPFTSLFWAIVVEFKFYLLFPFLLALVHRDGIRVLGVLLLGAILLRVLLVFDGAEAGSLTYWTIFGRIDQFLIGMGAAVFYRASSRHDLALLCPAALLAMGLLLFGYNQAGGFESQAHWKLLWPTLEGLVWALFILGYLHLAMRLPLWLSTAFAFVGEVSYSMYLLHMAVVAALNKIGAPQFGLGPGGDAFISAVLFVLPVTVAISTVTFRLIEKPFLRARVRYVEGPEAASSYAAAPQLGAGSRRNSTT